ncbi:MAG: nucleoside 2-deoxyribosyltransferase [Gammaproteobacteria bacterium]|nr:nucleoside 2-deoxyribosyltransferase [Gammaproteobacteria bacterium]
MNVIEKANYLLFELNSMYPKLGQSFRLSEIIDKFSSKTDEEKKEVVFLIKDVLAKELNYLVDDNPKNNKEKYKITAKGHVFLNDALHKPVPTNTVFCAMWFDKSTDTLWEKAIKRSIKKANYDPRRIDEEHFSENVMVKMYQLINTSQFVVADLTGERPCVYYEAGYAKAQGIKVIFTAKDKEKIHFDVSQYPIIFWKEEEMDKFSSNLYDRIINIMS